MGGRSRNNKQTLMFLNQIKEIAELLLDKLQLHSYSSSVVEKTDKLTREKKSKGFSIGGKPPGKTGEDDTSS